MRVGREFELLKLVSEDEMSMAPRSPSGDRGAPAGASAGVGPVGVPPDPEVEAKAVRRRFTREYKLRVLRLAAECRGPGAIGALLRREGLYSSHLSTWRAQQKEGSLAGPPKKRGPKAKPKPDPRIAQLERQNRALERKLHQAGLIIDVQKKVAEMLGITLATPEGIEDT